MAKGNRKLAAILAADEAATVKTLQHYRAARENRRQMAQRTNLCLPRGND